MGLTVCFTGHRDILPDDRKRLVALTDQTIRQLIATGAEHFRTGGAIGFDTVAALKVLELKKEFPEIKLDLYLPCRDQTKRWNPYDRLIYNKILRRADTAEFISEYYTPYCMLARDRQLVKGSDVCVSYLRRPTGGTAYTVQYAESNGVRVISLADALDGLDKTIKV